MGFKQQWIEDESRRFHFRFSNGTDYSRDGAPRPVLANEWYPAEVPATSKFMNEGSYLNFGPEDGSKLSRFSKHLRKINEEVISGDVLEKPSRAKLD